MQVTMQHDRSIRARKMSAVLARLYPEATTVLEFKQDWQLLIALILATQCTDARVNIVTKTLFKKYPTLSAFAHAPEGELEQAIYSTGFYRAKARNIRRAAAALIERFNGKLPLRMHELVTIPGIGRKSANVIIATVGEGAEGIAVDTHVRRFALRFDLTDHRDPKRIEQDLMEILPKKAWRTFNHRLVRYGQELCPARKHDCMNHPLTQIYQEAAHRWPRSR